MYMHFLCSPLLPLLLTWNPPCCDRIHPTYSQVARKLTNQFPHQRRYSETFHGGNKSRLCWEVEIILLSHWLTRLDFWRKPELLHPRHVSEYGLRRKNMGLKRQSHEVIVYFLWHGWKDLYAWEALLPLKNGHRIPQYENKFAANG